jgi:uncharacterized OB-fold protein
VNNWSGHNPVGAEKYRLSQFALIQLEEGPTMMSNIVQCDPDSVTTGMPVEVVFEAWSDEITMPQFRPLSEASQA